MQMVSQFLFFMQNTKIDGCHLESASECHKFKMDDKMAENGIDLCFKFLSYLIIICLPTFVALMVNDEIDDGLNKLLSILSITD